MTHSSEYNASRRGFIRKVSGGVLSIFLVDIFHAKVFSNDVPCSGTVHDDTCYAEGAIPNNPNYSDPDNSCNIPIPNTDFKEPDEGCSSSDKDGHCGENQLGTPVTTTDASCKGQISGVNLSDANCGKVGAVGSGVTFATTDEGCKQRQVVPNTGQLVDEDNVCHQATGVENGTIVTASDGSCGYLNNLSQSAQGYQSDENCSSSPYDSDGDCGKSIMTPNGLFTANDSSCGNLLHPLDSDNTTN
jgi:hypothetical protein